MTHKIEDANNRLKRLQQQGKDSTNVLERDNSSADVDCRTECVLTHSKGQVDYLLSPMYKHVGLRGLPLSFMAKEQCRSRTHHHHTSYRGGSRILERGGGFD